MEKMSVPFNYFYSLFMEKFRQELFALARERNNQEDFDSIIDLYFDLCISKEEQQKIYDKILWEICADYLGLSHSALNVNPKGSFEFVLLILKNMEDNPYCESFLNSLQFIYQEYLANLGAVGPALISSTDTSKDSLVILNFGKGINSFEFVNMELLERDMVMTKIVMMESTHQIGPIPNVLCRTMK